MSRDTNPTPFSQAQINNKRRVIHKKPVLVSPSYIYDFLIYKNGLQSLPEFKNKLRGSNLIMILHFIARHLPMATNRGKDINLKDISASGWWGRSYISDETGLTLNRITEAITNLCESGILSQVRVKNGRFLAFSERTIKALKMYADGRQKIEIEQMEDDFDDSELSPSANETGPLNGMKGVRSTELTGPLNGIDRSGERTQSSKGREVINPVNGKGGTPHALDLGTIKNLNRVDILRENIEPLYAEVNGYIAEPRFKMLNEQSEALVTRHGIRTFKSFSEGLPLMGSPSQLKKFTLFELFEMKLKNLTNSQ